MISLFEIIQKKHFIKIAILSSHQNPQYFSPKSLMKSLTRTINKSSKEAKMASYYE